MRIENIEQKIQKRTSEAGRVRYVVKYYDTARKRRSKSFTKLAHARRFRRDVEARVQRNEWVDSGYSLLQLDEYRAEVRDVLYAGKSASTVGLLDSLWRRHVAPRHPRGTVKEDSLGAKRLGRIDRDDLTKWIQRVVADPAIQSAATPRKIFHMVGQVFAHAVERRHLLVNPMPKPKDAGLPMIRPGDRRRLDGEPKIRRLLTPGGVLALADAIDERFASMILVGAGTGLRPQELAALRRRHVDLAKRLAAQKSRWPRRTTTSPMIGTMLAACKLSASPAQFRACNRSWRSASASMGLGMMSLG